MLEINTSFDDAQARALLAHWMVTTNHTMADAVNSAGIIAARSFGEKTWPKTLEEGTGAVKTQINRVYAGVSDAYLAMKDASGEKPADAFWAATHTRKNWKKAKVLLAKYGGKMAGQDILPFDDGAAHKRRRNARGRIPKGIRPSFIVQNETVSAAKGTTVVDRYIAKKQQLVGFTQAAWYNCMRELGGRNRRSKSPDLTGKNTEITIPFSKWVIRHSGKGFGKVYVSEQEDRYGIVLHNDVRWSHTALDAGTERYIMARSREHLLKYFIISIHKARGTIEREARRA